MATARPDSAISVTLGIQSGRHEGVRPVWKRIPAISFTAGTPAQVDLAQYVRNADGLPWAVAAGSLPTGVTLSASGLLAYDGSGSGGPLGNIRVKVTTTSVSIPFTLNSTTTGNLPWTFGHAFKEGDIPSGTSVVAGEPIQAVVKNRWPDGSVKYAVLSGVSAFVAGTPKVLTLTAGSPGAATPISLADLVAANPQITVAVGAFGTVQLAPNLASPVRQFVSGPYMSEWHYRLPVAGDTQLVVWLYVRLYAGGRIEYMASVENGYFDYTNAINKLAQLVVAVGGTTAYDSGSAIDIKHHTRVVAGGGHNGKLWIGGDPGITPAHNTAYLQATGMVPAFQAQSISTTTLNGFAQSYLPNAQHNLPGNALGGGGDSPSIGWLPRWDAAYVVSADARAFKGVLVNSLASGAWSVHWRDGATNQVVSYAAYPSTKKPLSAGSAYGDRNYYSAQYGTDWDISHGWLPGYTAYLLTADYWHLEELQFFVKWVHYSADVTARGSATGLMVRNLQSRGTAWANRNCGMAAAITPDDDSERAAYINAVGASMTWLRNYHTNQLGIVLEPDQAGWGDPGGQRTWMSDYVVGTLAWILDQKILTGAQLTDAQAFMLWAGNGLVQRFSDGTNPNGWHWKYQAYSPVVSTAAFPANQNQANFDTNWGTAFERAYGRANGVDLDTPVIKAYNWATPNSIPSWTDATSFGSGYFEYGMSALAQCVNQGIPGAAAAFARITSATNYSTCRNSLANDPRFGLAPRS